MSREMTTDDYQLQVYFAKTVGCELQEGGVGLTCQCEQGQGLTLTDQKQVSTEVSNEDIIPCFLVLLGVKQKLYNPLELLTKYRSMLFNTKW